MILLYSGVSPEAMRSVIFGSGRPVGVGRPLEAAGDGVMTAPMFINYISSGCLRLCRLLQRSVFSEAPSQLTGSIIRPSVFYHL